ncbi:hypothetical protein BDR26DRAFT_873085 [Obelidium mucronatum]|nr:hypothetical protein BDR26DRAFT_873085 [Obelidium mucronatum]
MTRKLPVLHNDTVHAGQLNLLRSLLESICNFRVGNPAPIPVMHQMVLFNRERQLSIDGYYVDHLPSSFSELSTTYRRLLVSGHVSLTPENSESPLSMNSNISQRTSIQKEKQINTTPFVWIQRDYHLGYNMEGPLWMKDVRCLAYPEIGAPAATKPQPSAPTSLPAVENPAFSVIHKITPVHVFQYSALTYNPHLVHYNKQHAVREGYTNCIIPGTLLATIAATHVENASGKPIVNFKYSLARPVCVGESVCVLGDGLGKVWVMEVGRGDSLQHVVVMTGSYQQ